METTNAPGNFIENPGLLIAAIRSEYFGDNFKELTNPIAEINTTEPVANSDLSTSNTWRENLSEAAIIFESVPLLGGAFRYGLVFGTVLATTKDPYLSGASLGVSTAMVEGGATYAAAHLLTHPNGSRALNLVDKVMDSSAVKKIVPDNAVMPTPVAAVVGLELGVPILMKIKKREDPELPQEQMVRKGLVATSWLAGACSLQGYLIAEGLTNLTEPKVVVPVVALLAGAVAGIKKIKDKYAVDKDDKV